MDSRPRPPAHPGRRRRGPRRRRHRPRRSAAEAEGQALVDAAKAQAEQLVTAAHAGVHDAQVAYATAHQAALDAGWQPAELARLGYPPPAGRRRRPPRPTAVAADVAGPASARTPADDTGPDEQPQHPAT